MRFSRKLCIALTLVGAILTLALFTGVSAASAAMHAVATPATVTHVLDTSCPIPGFTVGYACTIEPATVTTTSHTHIVVKKTVTQQLKQYEQVNHVIVAINMGKPMSGAGCTDPTKHNSWDFNVGDSFKNATKYHKSFYDTWQAGWKVCDWHIVKIGRRHYVKGKKANCRNTPIYIPINFALPRQRKLVVTFRSVKSFESTYDRWATSSHTTTYSCKAPFSLAYLNGQAVCFLATQIPTSTPPTQPTQPQPGPKAVCFIGGSPQYTWPSGYVAGQVGPNNQCIAVAQNNNCSAGQVRDSNGNCVNQANAAELHCQQVAQASYPGASVQFDNDTLTCIITQINGNCSNIVEIIGNGSPTISQQGNCNTNTTPPPPAPKPKPTITDIYQLNAQSIYEGYSYKLCATVQAQAGDAVTVTFGMGTPGHPGIGMLSQTSFSLTGSGTVCTTYTAPGETGTDTYTVYAHDNTAGTDASPVSATAWQVQALSNP